MKVVITGCAGFIGSHLAERLLKDTDYEILGVDVLTDNYDVAHKRRNLAVLGQYERFAFREEDILHSSCISEWNPELIVHLASSAGVRASLDNPTAYVRNNVEAFVHVLDEARKGGTTARVVYASSSSVYGANTKLPYSEDDALTGCVSPYACSKLAMEHFAHTFSTLYNLECIGFRFFTVYGPRGRPDMAPYKFLQAIHSGESISKYGDGTSSRDYTYVGDIVDGIVRACMAPAKSPESPSSSKSPRRLSTVYNLGNTRAVDLNTFIRTCEQVVGKPARIHQMGTQLGDVSHTLANIEKAARELGYSPQTSLRDGLQQMYESMGMEKNTVAEEVET
jgi:UDP-glucuronate 4-epimerase